VGYDVIVAGGGSAGCVAAARLIADEVMPAASHDWGFMAEPDERGRSVPLPRGRLMGGCSATNACVDRIELRGTTARGVRLAGGESIEADAIVVTAGSYASPAIVMRSGIGPAAALHDLGIGVAADLPGVGNNLIDHPLAAVDLPTTPGFAGPRFQVMLTLRSSLADPDGPPDLNTNLTTIVIAERIAQGLSAP